MSENEIFSRALNQLENNAIRNAEKDLAIKTTAKESVHQTDLIAQLVEKSKLAEKEAGEAKGIALESQRIANVSNNIAFAAILVSTIFSIITIIVAVSIGIGNG
ncbi:hypothetical protein IMCC1989_173 [gamma proteobacterium IMCC1989]|nr:hypothetical protein IMCC1989_173 [gamma proteobacterium IMCC1989]